MNFLADEGVDRQIVDSLRRCGHDVLYVAEMEPGISDDAVLDLANREGAILVTADKDFGELVFRFGRFAPGVILLRLAGLSSARKGEIVTAAISQHVEELPCAFVVVTSTMVRIRRQVFS